MKLEEIIRNIAIQCSSCKENDCPARVIFEYISRIGLNYFYHLYDKGKLPKEIRRAIVQCELASYICFLNF